MRGSILIYVLIISMFAVTVSFLTNDMAVEGYGDVRDIKNVYQSYIYARTAVDAILKVFEMEDFKYDSSFDVWVKIPVMPVPEGYVGLEIIPLNGKIPLNANNKKALHILKQEVSEECFYKINELLKGVNLKDITFNAFRYLCSYKDYENMKKKFTIGFDNRINLNFASYDVIKDYLPVLSPYADGIIDYRKEKPLKNVSNIVKIGGVPPDVFIKVAPYVTVRSSAFYIKIIVNLGDESYFYHSLVLRDRKRAYVVSFFAGGMLDYF